MAETTVPTKENAKQEIVNHTREDTRYLVPPVDIYEEQEALVVVADFPGVSRESINVRVEDNILTIEGKAGFQAQGQPIDTEFEVLNFHRQFELAETVDAEKIDAQLKNGVLTIRLPFREIAKPKQIQVKVA